MEDARVLIPSTNPTYTGTKWFGREAIALSENTQKSIPQVANTAVVTNKPNSIKNVKNVVEILLTVPRDDTPPHNDCHLQPSFANDFR